MERVENFRRTPAQRHAGRAVPGVEDRCEVDSGKHRFAAGHVVQHRLAAHADHQLVGIRFHQQSVDHRFAAVVEHVEDPLRPVHPPLQVGAGGPVERQVEHLADARFGFEQVEFRVYPVVDDVPADRHADFRLEGIGLFFGKLAQLRQQLKAQPGGLVLDLPERVVDAGDFADDLVELAGELRRSGAVVGLQHFLQHPPDQPGLFLRVRGGQFGQPHRLGEDAGITVGLHTHGQLPAPGRRIASSRACFRFLKPANAASQNTASTAASTAMNHSPWRT